MRHEAWERRSRIGVILTVLLFTGGALLTEGCSGESVPGAGGSGTTSSGSTGGDAADAGMQTLTLHPGATPLPGESECKVEITTGIPSQTTEHLPICTEIEYSTSPPTWGDHWPIWVAYKKYSTPLLKQMYVHNHEHGGVSLTYRCPNGCPEVVTALEKVFDDVLEDPRCFKVPGAPRAKMLMAPDPEAVAPIVLSSWNAHYKATCIDSESLSKFVSDVYGRGTEETCDNGIDVEDPSEGFLDCGDAGSGDGG